MGNKSLSMLYTISINGTELSEDRKKCITDLSIQELDNGSDSCTFVVSDPKFLYIEDNIFIEDVSVYVEFGWVGYAIKETFSGYISAIDISFPESGCPQLSIFCLDNTHLMNRKEKTRSWDNVTRAGVVKKIAAEYGFKCVVEPGYDGKIEETISQSGVTDIAFCENLASEETDLYKCKLIGDTLYYIKRGILKNPSIKVSYCKGKHEIISFTPKINKETKKESIDSADITSGTKYEDYAVASDSTTFRDVQGTPVNTSSDPTYNTGENSSSVGYVYDPKTGSWIETR